MATDHAYETSAVGTKRKRIDSLLDDEDNLQDAKRTKYTAYDLESLSILPSDWRYSPSTAAHTIIPYADPDWPEKRIVCLRESSNTDDGEDILWICGTRIPSLEHVWPPHLMKNEYVRRKRQDKLILQASEAFRERLFRRSYVQGTEYKAILKAEKMANHQRRLELHEQLLYPVQVGLIKDAVKIQQRVALFKARMSAVDEHERLRVNGESYDQPGARLDYLDTKAVTAWRNAEGRDVKEIDLRFRVCIAGTVGAAKPPIFVLIRVLSVYSYHSAQEVWRTLLGEAKRAYREWVRTQPREVHDGWGGMPEIWAMARGEGRMVETKTLGEWERVWGRMFEGAEKGVSGSYDDGSGHHDEKKSLDVEEEGCVNVYVNVPGA